MAKTSNIIRLASYPRKPDPAVVAKRRAANAGENDVAYDAAMADLESAPATSIAGVHAKFERLQSYLSDVQEGDELTELGWATVRCLCQGIENGLGRFMSKAVA